jgi:hypothetical protein
MLHVRLRSILIVSLAVCDPLSRYRIASPNLFLSKSLTHVVLHRGLRHPPVCSSVSLTFLASVQDRYGGSKSSMGTWILGTSKTQYSPQMINKKKAYQRDFKSRLFLLPGRWCSDLLTFLRSTIASAQQHQLREGACSNDLHADGAAIKELSSEARLRIPA